MTNSPLATHTNLSPNCTKPRNHDIDTITIHCVAGQCSVETLGSVFALPSRQASSNYGVGMDGRIGMYVEEKNRSWCSSNSANDNRAVTIEVSSDPTSPYAVNSKAYASLLDLVTDICKRNGIKKLLWRGDKALIGQTDKQNMSVHRWFAAKACPGDYLYEKHGAIADEVNRRLGAAQTPNAPAEETYRVRKSWADAASQIGAFSSLEGARAAADKTPGYLVFNAAGQVVYTPAPSKSAEEITVEAALRDGIIGDRDYWLGVLTGTTLPSKTNIQKLMDNAHKKISG